jgi:hypothetical protein
MYIEKRVQKNIWSHEDGLISRYGKLRTENLRNFYVSSLGNTEIKLKKTKWAGLVLSTGYMRNAYNFLVEEHEDKRPLDRLKRKFENNIKNGSQINIVFGHGLSTTG